MNGLPSLPILSGIVFLPLLGVAALLASGSDVRRIQQVSLAATLAAFFLSLIPLALFSPDLPGFQFTEHRTWIPSLGIGYTLGLDGLSLFLIPLTTFLSVLSVLVSWDRIQTRTKGYYACLLLLETGMLGVFVALDAVLFYLFWEAMLIPMFFIIGIWGSANRRYAAVKFFLYTLAGSVLLLVGLIIMAILAGSATGGVTFDVTRWYALRIPEMWQYALFLMFFIAFAVKVPLFPFHTWLPDAHTEAPTAGSVILAGVLLKMGVYGMLRFCFPLFPQALQFFAPAIITLGLVGVIYGALTAYAQKDLKKLVAYSSVSHMGLIVVGIVTGTLAGLKGGIVQMLNHGISTGGLFILVGALYERKHTRDLDKLGGLAGRLPVLAVFFVVMVLSSVGLPGLNGFVGEFLLLLGSFQYAWPVGVVAGITLILGAIYLLWMTQRALFEKDRTPDVSNFSDASRREICILLPLALLALWIGLYPASITNRLDITVHRIRAVISAETAAAVVPGEKQTTSKEKAHDRLAFLR